MCHMLQHLQDEQQHQIKPPGAEESEDDDEEELLQFSLAVQSREEEKPTLGHGSSTHSLTESCLNRHDEIMSVPQPPQPVSKRKREAGAAAVPAPAPSAAAVPDGKKARKAPPTVAESPASTGREMEPPQSQSDLLGLDSPDAVEFCKFLKKGWSHCFAVTDLGLDGKEGTVIMKPVDDPDVDNAKWLSVMQSFVPQLKDLEKLLTGGSKLKDQEIKSLASTLKKNATAAKAKKTGLKDKKTALLTDRVKGLADVAVAVKELRTQVVSARPKAIHCDEVQKLLEKLSGVWERVKCDQQLSYVSIPDLWVQSWVSHALRQRQAVIDLLSDLTTSHSNLYNLFYIYIYIIKWMFCCVEFGSFVFCTFGNGMHCLWGSTVNQIILDLAEKQRDIPESGSTTTEDFDLPEAVTQVLKELRISVFFGPSSVLHSHDKPTLDHAFGKMNDFFYFTKTSDFRDVNTLQVKLLANAIAQIVSDKDNLHSACLQLLAFLPMDPKDGFSSKDVDTCVLTPKVSDMLCILWDLAVAVGAILCNSVEPPEDGSYHALSYDNVKNLMHRLEELKPSNIQKVAKAFSKFSGAPVLKKMAQKVQVFFARLEIDNASAERVAALREHMSGVSNVLAVAHESSVSLMAVTGRCNQLKNLVECVASVPASSESQYRQVRSDSLELRSSLEDRFGPVVCFLSQSQLSTRRQSCYVCRLRLRRDILI